MHERTTRTTSKDGEKLIEVGMFSDFHQMTNGRSVFSIRYGTSLR